MVVHSRHMARRWKMLCQLHEARYVKRRSCRAHWTEAWCRHSTGQVLTDIVEQYRDWCQTEGSFEWPVLLTIAFGLCSLRMQYTGWCSETEQLWGRKVLYILQQNAATCLRCDQVFSDLITNSLLIILLQTLCWISCWKNFENIYQLLKLWATLQRFFLTDDSQWWVTSSCD